MYILWIGIGGSSYVLLCLGYYSLGYHVFDLFGMIYQSLSKRGLQESSDIISSSCEDMIS